MSVVETAAWGFVLFLLLHHMGKVPRDGRADLLGVSPLAIALWIAAVAFVASVIWRVK